MPKEQQIKLAICFIVISLITPFAVSDTFAEAPQANTHIIREIRHELATLPYYGVYDWLEFQVMPDSTVVLRGQVVRPTTKSDAEARVKEIDGVSKVVNEIEVLPLSPQDDRLRTALYRTIYSWDSPLFRYATQAVPPIHIIVSHGRATLKGIVDSKADAQLAYMRARGVPGLFDVKNELQIAGGMPR
ncbi:MAG TPA: transport-associated protein [Blastocatellia bacterium]|nr:transport-associated protein [Blastocatellia bacterium]